MELSPAYKPKIRVASVQMGLQQTHNAQSFFKRLDHLTATAADYGADFVCFPEHYTLQLLSGEETMLAPEKAIDRLTDYTDALKTTLSDLAKKHAINIIGGSHATRLSDGSTQNIAFVARRDGTLAEQAKLHPTPDERGVWHIGGGKGVSAIDTDCGPIGIQICYDSEFPELGRSHAAQGVGLIFVPYCTDTRHGHLRVRYCCHARTIENQCYVVTSGLVGMLSNVANLDMAYAQSAILTPSDLGFSRDGIAAEATANIEQVIVADLDMRALNSARIGGSVRNLADRRDDLYGVIWKS